MFAGRDSLSQGGVKKEAPSPVSSIKSVVHPSGATGALGKRQASLESIIINDSEGEPDVSGHAAADASRTSLPFSCDGPTRNLEECKSAHRTTGHRSSSSSCESDMPLAAKRHKKILVQSQSQARGRACTSNADSHAKTCKLLCMTSKDGDNCEPDVEGDVMQQDQEAGPAFELPSQMPRELRLWAWDKRAGQHPPNLQKLYPAHAKRVRKAPQRYTGVRTPAALQTSQSEVHCRPAHSHSGEQRKERQGGPNAAARCMQAQTMNEDDVEDDSAQRVPGPSGECEADISLQGKLHCSRQEAALHDKAAAMHGHTFPQEDDSRSQACPAPSGVCEASHSSERPQEAEVLQLKVDNQLLREKIAALEQSTVHPQQTTSTQRNACTTTDVLRFLETASARQLVEVVRQVLNSLRQYKPAELDGISSPQDPKAERVEQLLKSLGPHLQGTNTDKWFDAVRCLTEALKDVRVAQCDLERATEDVCALKESCLSGHELILHRLIAQLEELCNMWHGWLINRPRCIARYERKAAELQQLQDRVAVCASAQRNIRQR